jgi:O-antigen/teichoic acid export membrane protein
MVASANLLGTGLGIIGSLVQARFISPDDLGFVRKYSVVSGYAIFLSLGLFLILQREYPVLMGRGDEEGARRAAAIGQTWCLITSGAVCSVLLVVSIMELVLGDWRAACGWFIQVVSVWTILYGGYLTCTFRSGQEFERLAKNTFLSSLAGFIVIPLFFVWPFATLVLRSIAGSLTSAVYLHVARPIKVGLYLPLREFLDLVKRGMRLFVGDYLRYSFWPTVEIWLMLMFAGDVGVGLLAFSTMICIAVGQFATAVNQIYLPRLAEHYGKTGSLGECLKLSVKPTLLNVLSAVICAGFAWFILPPILRFAFPKYVLSIPLIQVLLFDTIIVALSLPLYMVAIQEDYLTTTVSAVAGLAAFLGIALFLQSLGLREMSVVWGSIVGRFVFVAVGFLSLTLRLRRDRRMLISQPSP